MISRVAIALFALTCLAAPTAHAQCALTTTLGWTFPADGQTDVPVNTLIWVQVATADSSLMKVSLDGVVLQPAQTLNAFQPGAPLSSNAVHHVHVEIPADYDPYLDAGPQLSTDFSFTSSDTAVNTIPGAPSIQDIVLLDGGVIVPMTPVCQVAENIEGCFDVGPLDFFRLDFTGDAIAYQVDVNPTQPFGFSYLWPQLCSPTTSTEVRISDESMTQACFQVRGLNAAGQAGPVTEKCASTTTPPPAPKSGCSSGLGDLPMGALMLVLIAAIARRPRVN